MMHWRCLIVLLALLPTITAAVDRPQSVAVFIKDSRVIDATDFPESIPITVHNLGAPQQIERALSNNLPTDTAAAIAEVKARLARYTPDQIQKTWSGRFRAQQVGITKTPAIVFDGTDVVYGITQLSHALTLWENAHAQMAE